MSENRNLMLAITLSLAVLLGWQYFVGVPQMQKQKEAQQRAQATTAPANSAAGPSSSTPAPATGPAQPATTAPAQPGAPATREAALALSARVPVENALLRGSIALAGARIDDITLTKFHEQVDKKSPNIILLAPQGAPGAFYAEFGWVGAQGATVALPNEKTVWTAPAGARLTPQSPVTLTFDNGQGLVFRREFAIDSQYVISVKDSVENKGAAAVQLYPYGLISRHGTPATAGYYILHEGLVGIVGDAKLEEYTYSKIEKDKTASWKGKGGWLGITDKYWAAALLPDQSADLETRFSSSAFGALKTYQTDYLMAARTVEPGASTQTTTRLFAGAKEVAIVNGYSENLGVPKFDLLIDWGWFYFITKPLFQLMHFFFNLLGNFGLAILAVTLVVKAVFFPLANKSYASMVKMKKVQPEMMELRDKFADDKMKQQQALMDLYKREQINPVAGCWPMLVQIPVFFALYKVIFITIEMRHAPFYGWIHDLSAPDPTSLFNLFGLLPFGVPEFLLIGIWPLVMGVTMWIQMQMNPAPTDQIQAVMFRWMPIMFTFMLASFPAGLVIYWSWNNLLSILQQWLIMRRYGVRVELWDNVKAMFGKGPAAPAA